MEVPVLSIASAVMAEDVWRMTSLGPSAPSIHSDTRRLPSVRPRITVLPTTWRHAAAQCSGWKESSRPSAAERRRRRNGVSPASHRAWSEGEPEHTSTCLPPSMRATPATGAPEGERLRHPASEQRWSQRMASPSAAPLTTRGAAASSQASAVTAASCSPSVARKWRRAVGSHSQSLTVQSADPVTSMADPPPPPPSRGGVSQACD
mmetsp:Transcript_6573/g.17820  ORF Transcript_6573/g.17820 Transcript_6573/m.17820 type:complete len:206 (-) Transcript_6573:423-1040(-)